MREISSKKFKEIKKPPTEDILEAINTVNKDIPRIMYLVVNWPLEFIPSAPNSVINKVVAPAIMGKMNVGSGLARLVNHHKPPSSRHHTTDSIKDS